MEASHFDGEVKDQVKAGGVAIVFRRDFLQNFKSYTMGFLSYMVMMPVFTNIFQIYAMCNLHDVSWGNRPTSTGQEAFSANKQQQANSENDYKVYRTNFVMLWLLGNVAYYIAILEIVQAAGGG